MSTTFIIIFGFCPDPELPGNEGINDGVLGAESGFKTSTYLDRADLFFPFPSGTLDPTSFVPFNDDKGMELWSFSLFLGVGVVVECEVFGPVETGIIGGGASSSFGFSAPPFLLTHFFRTGS